MLSLRDQEKLKALMILLGDSEQEQEKKESNIDVSNRARDELGRFARVEDLASESAREIRLVKVKGSYGTYLVQTKTTWKDKLYIGIFIGLIFLIF